MGSTENIRRNHQKNVHLMLKVSMMDIAMELTESNEETVRALGSLNHLKFEISTSISNFLEWKIIQNFIAQANWFNKLLATFSFKILKEVSNSCAEKLLQFHLPHCISSPWSFSQISSNPPSVSRLSSQKVSFNLNCLLLFASPVHCSSKLLRLES